MEGGLAPARRISSPAFYSSIPNLQISNVRTEHDKDDHDDNLLLASTESSSRHPSSTNSQAATVSRNTRENEYNLLTLPPPLGHAFIVQMPRDQIFRVPPPENANLVKRFAKPLAKKRSHRNFKACFPWLYALVALFVILVLALVILQFFLKPQSPELTVKNLVFKNSTRPEYDISLIVKSPYQNIFTIIYEGAEDASVVYKGKTLAEGAFPAFEQGPNDARNVMLSFSSLKRNSLPADLEKSLMGKKKMAPLEFTLMMEMPTRSKLLVIPATRSSKISVKCEFTIDSLEARTKILAQKCPTSVQ